MRHLREFAKASTTILVTLLLELEHVLNAQAAMLARRRFADLRAGASLDGVMITGARVTPYAFDATYDILPESDTGAYFAGGVLIGSTLAPSVKRVLTPTAPYLANPTAP